MRKFLQVLMIFVVICSSSSHLVVLQVIAWGGMLAENVQEEDLQVAITKTFDGENPCGLCEAIDMAAEKSGDDRDGTPLPNVQILDLKLLPLDRLALLSPAPVRVGIVGEDFSGRLRGYSPAVPPPQLV